MQASTLIAAAALLGSCGGHDDGADASNGTVTSGATDGVKKLPGSAKFDPPTAIPADANVKGMFSPVYDWPLIPIHMVLLPDGRVMSYGTNGDGTQTGKFIYDVWDPEGGLAGGHTTLANTTPTDTFCSTQIVLPAGDQVFIGGGDNWNTTIPNATNNLGNNTSLTFSIATNTLTPGPNMFRPRWYATSTTLVNGETLVAGGLGGDDAWEVRGADGAFRLLNTQTGWIDWYYPRNFVRPDGKVVGVSANGYLYNVDPTGAGSASWLADLPAPYFAPDTTAVMYRPGKLIQFGGEANAAVLIDFRSAEVGLSKPTITATAPLSSQRRLVTGTILANGQVLATGGSTVYNQMIGVNYNAEIWDPVTGQWTLGAPFARARLYHHTALLLLDGTVMLAGGGAPGPLVNTNFELYFPPYLFGADGTLAPRPTIVTAPTVLDIGKSFSMQVGGSGTVSRVVLIKTGSVTHGNNMEQRYIDLPFNAAGTTLTVQPPSRPGEATPGSYMLIALNSAGVPSVAKVVRMTIGGPDAANAPVLSAVADRAGTTGTPVMLTLVATDPNGQALTYSAAGLPLGLAINAATGAITGTPTQGGVYDVTVAASDGVNVATTTFTWSMTGPNPLTVSVPALPAAQVTGATATYTAATQNGVNPLYRWTFGDGSAGTAYSTSPTATHTYAQPGRYFVTVTAIDDRGIEQRQTLQQTIYLPTTAQLPTASTTVALQQPATGAARLWAVNQDNDSVSVFNAQTGAKLAEVAVGSEPRTLAVASNGMVWVTNKRGASISVIDATSLAVSRTIALPRASQPHGVAMAPGGGFALVVLEGTGQLLKFSTATYAQVGAALAVGEHPRHVSIASGGGLAYVSSFITPPLPGEATATVGTTGVGAQVRVVDTAAMTLATTVVLAHSDKIDAENQGAGVPNYLGVAVISPDGTQAWVPSKQDNVKRGSLRNGLPLTFQNTVRAISSRITLANHQEVLASRIDHDNAGLANAAAFDPRGNYLFVALETSRQVAVIDAHTGAEINRLATGLAPQGLAVAADGNTLFVHNFMSRTIDVHDLTGVMTRGSGHVPLVATLPTVATEELAPAILRGKQLFYDAADVRLARDRYISCASCHNDGGGDGRVWDMGALGEGLRNTISLRGRSGIGQGLMHWSGNFDEVHDFEAQIRNLAGGTGLLTDAQLAVGTRNQPLGDRKAGLSADLDALAAYVGSLSQFDPSPLRNADGSLTASGTAGASVFAANCVSCHTGNYYTDSISRNIGTIKPTSGKRLGATLTGIDTPTLRDAWSSAPYLHDGSAPTVEAAIQAHAGLTLAAGDLANVASYVRQIGREETGALFPTSKVRYVRLQALTEVNGGPLTSMAEFNLLDAAGVNLPRALWQVSVDSADAESPATNAIDGTTTIWLTQWRTAPPPTPHTFTVDLGANVMVGGFRYLPPQGANNNGQIASWNFQVSQDGIQWVMAAQGTFANTPAEKTVTFGPEAANRAPTLAALPALNGTVGTALQLALDAADADGDALTYAATGLPAGLTIDAATGVIGGTPTTAATYNVTAQVNDGRGGVASRSFAWTIATTPSSTTSRYVRLRALSEVNGNPWTTMAEFNLVDAAGATLSRALWQVSADSAEADAPATNAIDDSTTLWHTQWRAANPPPPHTFTVDLGASVAVGGFRYLPAQGGNNNGQIASWNFYTSPDGYVWNLAATGTFANTVAEKTVMFAVPNRPPTLAAVLNLNIVRGASVTFPLGATDADGDPLAYTATGLPAGLTINAATGVISGTPTTAATSAVTAQVSDGRGGVASRSFTWTITTTSSTTASRYVRLQALSEVNGNPWTTMAEFNLVDAAGANLSRALWQVSADSAESDLPVTNAIDGLTTLWHTQWRTANPPPPHTFAVDLGANVAVGGFRYLPPQGANNNGQIATWNFYTSADGNVWNLAETGSFANTLAEKTVTLNRAPTLAAVANQTATVGTAATLTLSATDPDGNPLTYAATGLPAGLTINAATGVISGTPTTAGTFSVTVQVSDGRGGAASRSFTWTVS